MNCGLQSGEILVQDNISLLKAVDEAVAGSTIPLEDGVYRDVQLVVHADGGPERKITVQALHPGKACPSGNILTLGNTFENVNGVVFHFAPLYERGIETSGEQCDFTEVLSQPFEVRPLGSHDVGPGWCTQYPGTYSDSGVYKSDF